MDSSLGHMCMTVWRLYDRIPELRQKRFRILRQPSSALYSFLLQVRAVSILQMPRATRLNRQPAYLHHCIYATVQLIVLSQA